MGTLLWVSSWWLFLLVFTLLRTAVNSDFVYSSTACLKWVWQCSRTHLSLFSRLTSGLEVAHVYDRTPLPVPLRRYCAILAPKLVVHFGILQDCQHSPLAEKTPAHGVGHGGPRGLSEPVALMPFMQQGIWILHTVSSSSFYQLWSAWMSLSRFPAERGFLKVPFPCFLSLWCMSSGIFTFSRDRPNDFNGYGYFYALLHCTGLGFQANIVEEYVLLSALLHIFAFLLTTRDQKLSSGLMSGQLSSAISG